MAYFFALPEEPFGLERHFDFSEDLMIPHLDTWYPSRCTHLASARFLAWHDGAGRLAFVCSQFLRLYRGRLQSLSAAERADFRILRSRCQHLVATLRMHASCTALFPISLSDVVERRLWRGSAPARRV